MRSVLRTSAFPGRGARARERGLGLAVSRDIALVCLADGIVGTSFGAVSVAGGLPMWAPIAMSLGVFAGGSQFAAVGVMLAGGSPITGALAGLTINTRHLLYGFAVADVLDGRWWARLAGSHVMVDESVAFALGQQGRRRRRAAFWTSGLALFAVWNLAVAAGALAGRAISDTGAFGLDAMFPAVMLSLALPALADRGNRHAALLGAAVAVAAVPLLPAGLPVVAGLAGLLILALPRGRAGKNRDTGNEVPAKAGPVQGAAAGGGDR